MLRISEMIRQAQTVWQALLRHIPADRKMDKTSRGGYQPTASVLANRERHRQYDEIKNLGTSVRTDYWQEWDSKRGVDTGFRNNQNVDAYNQAVAKLADLAKKSGFKPKIKKTKTLNYLSIRFNEARLKEAAKLIDKYLFELFKSHPNPVEISNVTPNRRLPFGGTERKRNYSFVAEASSKVSVGDPPSVTAYEKLKSNMQDLMKKHGLRPGELHLKYGDPYREVEHPFTSAWMQLHLSLTWVKKLEKAFDSATSSEIPTKYSSVTDRNHKELKDKLKKLNTALNKASK